MISQRSKHGLLLLTFLFLAACAQGGGGAISSTNSYSGSSSGDDLSGGGTTPTVPSNCGAMNTTECQVMDLVNVERAKQGLAALGANSKCIAEAQSHAQDMVANNYFAHDGPNETTSQRFARFGLSGATWGENIAAGYTTASAVMTGWMNSSGHRANILGAGFRSMGVGLATKSDGTKYWVQCFTGY